MSAIFLLYVVKIFGATQAGLFLYAYAFLPILTICARFGFDKLALKNIQSLSAKYHDSGDIVYIFAINFISIVKASIIVTIAAIFLTPFIIEWTEFDILDTMIIVSLAIGPYAIVFLNSDILRGRGMFNVALYFINISIPLLTIFLHAVTSDKAVISDLAICLVVSCYVQAIWSTVIIVKRLEISLSEFFSCIKRVAGRFNSSNESRYLFAYAFVNYLSISAPLVMMGLYANSFEIALFSVIQKLSISMGVLLLIVNFYYEPLFARLVDHDPVKLKRVFAESVKLLYVLSTPVALIIIYFAEDILGLFSKDFSSYRSILFIAIFGQYINIVTGPLLSLMIMGRNTFNAVMSTGFPLLLSIPLYIFILSDYGALGAMASVIFNQFFKNSIAAYYVFITYRILPLPYISR